MTKEEFAATVAKLVAGLQVPVSVLGHAEILGASVLGHAEILGAWQELLYLANGGFGWTNAEALETEFRKVLGLQPKELKGDHPVKTSQLKISYNWDGSDQLTRMVCRELEQHDLPEGGREGQEKPGAWTCRRCGVVKVVKQALR